MLLYLDTLYWRRLLTSHTHLVPSIETLLDAGRLTIPRSMVLVLETSKAHPDLRAQLVPLQHRLTRGRFLLNPISLFRLEHQRYREGHHWTWVRDRVVTSNIVEALTPTLPVFGGLLARIPAERVLDLLNTYGDSVRTNAGVNAIFARTAKELNEQRPTKPLRDRLLSVLGPSAATLPRDEDQIRPFFPSEALRTILFDAIYAARAKGAQPNDVPDSTFLCQTLPYFDAVTMDSAMADRVGRARRDPRAADLIRARVIGKVEDLEAVLDSLSTG